jgi:hypothetical protein
MCGIKSLHVDAVEMSSPLHTVVEYYAIVAVRRLTRAKLDHEKLRRRLQATRKGKKLAAVA